MDWETFVEKYKPIQNKVKGAAIDGYMFETFGDELADLRAKANKFGKKEGGKNGYHVWTLIDNNDGKDWFLNNGWHIVNRLGYIITKIPWNEGEDIEVEV